MMQARQGQERIQATPQSFPSFNLNPSFQHTKPAAPGLLARLHAFLPNPLSSGQSQPIPTPATRKPEASYIKTRIITWNMHDSLPKGNLEDLLGSVPPFISRSIVDDKDRMALPGLSLEDGHPYHIVVVAGQECPTLSGIPMGITANFKHWDREKEKHKDHNQEIDPEKDKWKEKHLLQRAESSLKKIAKNDSQHLMDPNILGKDSAADTHVNHHTPHVTSGWSAVLEDWFANGIGSLHEMKPVITEMSAESSTSPEGVLRENHNNNNNISRQISLRSPDDGQPPFMDVNWKPGSTTSDGVPHTPEGPYELLVKDRLMGIYVAVFVHRDVRPLIRGFSTDSVPTGLIGGRLGNKGGVGVSVDFNGTSLLFINAHLAAHEDKSSLRIANLSKIKAGLSVDAFLPPDDPRTVAEDVTEKFDYTWIFGDLNFRLNISRLHADWLISRKEYSQALAFDQLSELLKTSDSPFSGLHEADINFPPTFKYDLQRPRSRSRNGHRHSMRHGSHEAAENGEEDRKYSLSDKHGEDEDETADFVSVDSTSTITGPTHRRDITCSESDSSLRRSVSSSSDIHSPAAFASHAARKAKSAWTSFLHSAKSKRQGLVGKRMSSSAVDATRLSVQLPSGVQRSSSVNSGVAAGPKQNAPMKSTAPNGSRQSLPVTPISQVEGAEGSISESEKGVYDSSSKQRVPSWCDRILWKSTVKPPCDETLDNAQECNDAEDPNRVQGPATRVGQFFSKAFRPRPRQISTPTMMSESSTVPMSAPPKPSLPVSSSLFQIRSLEPSSRPLSGENMLCNGYDRSVPVPSSVVGREKIRRLSLPPSQPRHLAIPTRPHISEHTESDPSSAAVPPPSPVAPSALFASRRWLQNFLGRDSSQPIADVGLSQDATVPYHRRGDVVAISYHTLDDRQMRRLKAHSDHRPVIGSYAIYI